MNITTKSSIDIDWKKISVLELIKPGSASHKGIKQNEYLQEGKYPVVDQGKDLICGYSNREEKLYKSTLPVIVFGDHTRIVKYIDFPFITGADGTKIIVPADNILPRLLFYILLNLDLPGRGYNRHFKILKEQVVHVPNSKDEQQKIVEMLDSFQNMITSQNEIVNKIVELKLATLQAVFEKTEGMEIKKLAEISRIERGKFAHRPRNDPDFYGGDFPFIQTADVTKANGHIKTYSQTLNNKGLSVSKIFPKGTIVITIAANIGYTGILDFDSAFPDSLIGITPDPNINREYLNYFLMTQQESMDSQASRGTQKNINIEFLQPWPVKIPSKQKQDEIANTFITFDKQIDLEQKKKDLYQELFASLMNKLMSGEMRVKNRMIN